MTQDVGRTECGYWHVKVESVHESFIAFSELEEQTGKAFDNDIVNIMERKQLVVNKYRGQGYDGAANLSRKYPALQTFIEGRVPTALCVH